MVYVYIIDVSAGITVDYWFNYADVALQRVSVRITQGVLQRYGSLNK